MYLKITNALINHGLSVKGYYIFLFVNIIHFYRVENSDLSFILWEFSEKQNISVGFKWKLRIYLKFLYLCGSWGWFGSGWNHFHVTSASNVTLCMT